MTKEEEDTATYNLKEAYTKEQEDFEARFQDKLERMELRLKEKLDEQEYWREKLIKRLEKEATTKKKKKKGKKKKK